jgi:T4 RnlA family RNA ligase
MKVKLPIEEGYFNITPIKFCDLDSFLITPEIDAKWNNKNLHFRSLITDKVGNVLSSGFPKFFNYGEKPECYPKPEKYQDWKILNKLDGSLLIADLVNGVFSMRTRGTASYITQENYKDFELLPAKYPKIPEFLKYNQHYSLLFEILTPNNVIVVRPKEVEFYFLGAISKETLEMANGEDLLTIWKQIGCPPVPEQYEFSSAMDLSSLSETVKYWKGKEGVVLVYNNGQNRIKLKSDWYCQLHRIKSQLSSTNNLVEYYVQNKMPSYEDFYQKIETDFDFEIAEQLKDQLLKISETGEKCKKDVANMKDFCCSIRSFETRKQQAEHILMTYKTRSSYVFNLLDGKELTDAQWNKLILDYLNTTI